MFSLFQEKPPEDTPSDSPETSSQENSRGADPEGALSRLGTLSRRLAARIGALVRPAVRSDAVRSYGARLAAGSSALPAALRSNRSSAILAAALVVALVFGFHERQVAARLSAASAPDDATKTQPAVIKRGETPAQQQLKLTAQTTDQMAAQMKDTRAQIDAMNAKLDSLAAARQAPPAKNPPAPVARRNVVRPASKIPKPDPRWKLMQSQIDSQGRQIDAQGKQIESTRQELASTRTDLQGSIAKTHEELVVLQKKGERNYYEFDLDKSKNFHTTGPVGISLRKANTKHRYADLELLVDDRQVSKKHLNLYEPVVFYPSDERRPLELVINSITKNHVRGYVSAPRYRTSELSAGSASAQSGSVPTQQAATGDRRRLNAPR